MATVPWLPDRAPSAVGLAVPAGVFSHDEAIVPPFDVIDIVDYGPLRWICLRDGATLVAPAGFDPAAPFGLLNLPDEHWRLRRFVAERLRRRLAGEPLAPVLPSQARRRFADALRALDAHAAGASYRELAAALFSEARVAREHWPTSSLKAHCARLAAHGRWLTSVGWRQLLRGRLARRSLVPRR